MVGTGKYSSHVVERHCLFGLFCCRYSELSRTYIMVILIRLMYGLVDFWKLVRLDRENCSRQLLKISSKESEMGTGFGLKTQKTGKRECQLD